MIYRSQGYNEDAERISHNGVAYLNPGDTYYDPRARSTRQVMATSADPMMYQLAVKLRSLTQQFPDMPSEVVAAAGLTNMPASELQEMWADAKDAEIQAKKDAQEEDRWDNGSLLSWGGLWGDTEALFQSGQETAYRALKGTSRAATAVLSAPQQMMEALARDYFAYMSKGNAEAGLDTGWAGTVVDPTKQVDLFELIANPEDVGSGFTVRGAAGERTRQARYDAWHGTSGPQKGQAWTLGRGTASASLGAWGTPDTLLFKARKPGAIFGYDLSRVSAQNKPLYKGLGGIVELVPGIEISDEQAYNMLSGAIDFWVATKGDPGAPLFKHGSRIARNATGAPNMFRAADLTAENAGAIRSMYRDWVHGPTVEKFLAGKQGQELVKNFTKMTSVRNVREAMGRQGDVRIWGNIARIDNEADMRKYLGEVFNVEIPKAAKIADVRKAAKIDDRFASMTEDIDKLHISDYGMKARLARNLHREALRFKSRIGASSAWFDDPTQVADAIDGMFDAAKVAYADREAAFKILGDWKSPADTYRAVKQAEDVVRKVLLKRNGFAEGSDYDKILKMQLRMFHKTVDDAGVYALDALGKPVADSSIIVAGAPTAFGDVSIAAKIGSGPVWENQFLNSQIIMPDARMLRQQASALRGVVGRVKLKEVGVYGDLAVANWWDSFVNKPFDKISYAWKFVQLMRMGAVVRNVGEAQASMAANGAVSLFRQPLEYMALVVGAKRGTIKYAAEDFTGRSWQEILDDTSLRHAYKEALPRSSRRARQAQLAARDKVWTAVERNSDDYARGWAEEIVRFTNNPTTRRLAQALRSDDPEAAIRQVKDDFWDGGLKHWREMLIRDPALDEEAVKATGEIKAHMLLDTRAGADAYIDQVYIERGLNVVAPEPDILDAIASQEFKGYNLNYLYDHDGIGPRSSRSAWRRHTGDAADLASRRRMAGSPGSKASFRGRKELQARLDELKASEIGPLRVRYHRYLEDVKEPGKFKQIQDWMWDMLYAEPSARLSVHPGFVQQYAKELRKLAPYMDETALSRALDYLPPKIRNQVDWDAVRSNLGKGESRLTIEEADRLATQRSVRWARDTFYDVVNNNRLEAYDILRFIAPFGEAWQDAITRWSKYLAKNPSIYRRVVRAADEVEKAGLVTEDENGDMVFHIPFSGPIMNAVQRMAGIENPAPADMVAPVKGLNMVATSGLPGVGPIVTVPAALLIPEKAMPDLLQQVVVPFGSPDVKNGLLEALAPAWAQRLRAASSLLNRSPEQSRQYMGLVSKIISYYQSSGIYDAANPTDAERMIADAKRAASMMYLTRSAAQFMSASPPKLETFVKTPNEGLVNFFTVVADYRKMQLENPDDAVGQFLSEYGPQLYLAIQPTTYVTQYGPSPTAEFGRWRDKNDKVFNRYSDVAGLFGPGYEWSEQGFDFDEYNRQLADGSRASIIGDTSTASVEDWIRIGQNNIGEWKMQAFTKLWDAQNPNAKTDERLAVMAQARAYVHSQFPGWRDEASLARLRKIEVSRGIEELTRMSQDADASSMPGMESLRGYLEVRSQLLELMQRAGMNTISGGGVVQLPTSSESMMARATLARYAEQLASTDPYFARAWREFLSREGNMNDLYEEANEYG